MGVRRLTLAAIVLLVLSGVTACTAYTQGDREFRAVWVDAWGAGYMQQSQVDQLLGVVGDPNSKGDVRNANCNAVIIQVRRRADRCYPSDLGEPYMTGLTPSDFNALQAVINAAHDTTGGKKRIEVHAWIVTFATASGVTGPVYYEHNNPSDSDNYWMTQDDSGNETADKAFDPGHPKCEKYTVDICMELINRFDIDGLHYDYIRFTGANQGYNPTSIARFNERYDLTGKPDPDDDLFSQWRRDQITAVVRQVYARTQAVKPGLKITGSFVTWNPSPDNSTREAFEATRPFYQVYSDWDSWMNEGIVDAAFPMTYYNWASLPNDYTNWINFEKDNKHNRHMYIGVGTGSNSLSNAMRELKMTRDASPAGKTANGFCIYSYGSPYSGGTWSGFSPTFVSDVANSMVDVPDMTWKTNPTKGHISGTVTHIPEQTWADGALVSINGPETRSMLCDGTGFYAFIDLTPGVYTMTVSKVGCVTQQRQVEVAIGDVTGNMYVNDFALITAPIIANVDPLAMTTTSATIGWDTDQASSSQVEYGLTTSYGYSTPLDANPVMNHAVVLNSLLPNRLYHYRVTSANANGSRTSKDFTFTTGSHHVTLVANPNVGGVCTGGGWYVTGSSVTAKAVLNPDYFFVSWSSDPEGGSAVSNSNPYTFNMPAADVALYANMQSSIADIIIESESGGLNRSWYSETSLAHSSAKSSAAGCTPGIGSRYGSLDGTLREAVYAPAIQFDGMYQVSVTWGSSSSGYTSIPHYVTHRDGQFVKNYNQSSAGNLYNKWNVIGTFPFEAGSSGTCGDLRQSYSGLQSGKRIMADAAKWVYMGPFAAVAPSPANGLTDVAISPTLSWTPGGTTGSYDVYLGTSTASLTQVSSSQTSTSFDAGTLIPNTTYYWRVDSFAFGKTTTGDVWSFVTAPIPPTISNVQVTNVTSSSATVTWETDVASTSQVIYGTTVSYGQSTTEDTSMVTSHSVTLSGLAPNTVYHLVARSVGGNSLAGYSSDTSFLTQNAPIEIIVDNLQGTSTGTWTPMTDSGGWPTTASQYVCANNTKSTTTATFTWTPTIAVPGHYNVYCWYKSGSDRTTSARYTTVYSGGQMVVTPISEAANGSQWVQIATGVQFDAGTGGYVQLGNKTGENDATKKVVADAIKFAYAENDITPPSAPSNLVATAVSTSQIDLTWTASTDDKFVMGYKVFRDSQIYATTASTSFSDTGLEANSQHVYAVTAFDARYNESAPSSAVARWTFARPVAPGHVSCSRVIGVWYNTPAFTFTNDGLGSGKLSSYRFTWDHSPTHTWTDTETTWSTPSVVVNSSSSPQGWYLHAKGYNGDGVPCGALDIGPYLCDAEAPTAPAGLTATAASTSRIDLAWDASTDNLGVTSYKVYRNSQLLTTTTSTSCSDSGLTTNTQYTYTVSACDAATNESPKSASVPRYTLARVVAPTHVICDKTAGAWTNGTAFTFTNDGLGSGKLSSYRVAWDQTPTHTWTDAETPWTTTSTVQNAATSPSGWYFHAKGYNGDGVACGTLDMGPYLCDAQAPSVPTNLSATAVNTYRIDLAWDASTDNNEVTLYKIYRNSQLLTATSTTSFTDTGLTANVRYTYEVSACDAATNESARSTSVARYTLARPVASAHVTCDRNTNTPYPTSGFTFTNDGLGGGKLAYYRCVWDNSSTHTWGGAEPEWATTQTTLNATSTAPWFLHLRGYNGDGASCGDLTYGPYYCGVSYTRICDAINNPDGTQVIITAPKLVTAVFGSYFYIEEPDRTQGIRIGAPTTRSIGDFVSISGTLAGSAGERYLTDIQILSAGPDKAPLPFLLRASLLGGKAPNAYTLGVAEAYTPYNVGLLVRLVGRVASPMSGSFVLDDGSTKRVRVYSDKSVTDGNTVGVTGVCCLESGVPVIRTRSLADVMIY